VNRSVRSARGQWAISGPASHTRRVSDDAFIDESGQIGVTPLSSDHFVMSAVVCRESNFGHLDALLLELRDELGRGPTERLNWNIKRPEQRLATSQIIGGAMFIRTVSVIVCKRHLRPPMPKMHIAYLFTLRFSLERLSWLGRRYGTETKYTLSHVKHFRNENLKTYEFKLRELGTDTQIDWRYIDPYGGRISNDTVTQSLQIADLVASATARAFEEDDQQYLLEMAPRIFRGNNPFAANVLTTYGLKMHPWREDVRPLYPWVLELR
jgi:hypothetical protein